MAPPATSPSCGQQPLHRPDRPSRSVGIAPPGLTRARDRNESGERGFASTPIATARRRGPKLAHLSQPSDGQLSNADTSPMADLYEITALLASIDNLGVAKSTAPTLTFGIRDVYHSRYAIEEYPSGLNGFI